MRSFDRFEDGVSTIVDQQKSTVSVFVLLCRVSVHLSELVLWCIAAQRWPDRLLQTIIRNPTKQHKCIVQLAQLLHILCDPILCKGEHCESRVSVRPQQHQQLRLEFARYRDVVKHHDIVRIFVREFVLFLALLQIIEKLTQTAVFDVFLCVVERIRKTRQCFVYFLVYIGYSAEPPNVRLLWMRERVDDAQHCMGFS